jgi:succinate dehydrogenase / fumarate reductase cytochrome b subunit
LYAASPLRFYNNVPRGVSGKTPRISKAFAVDWGVHPPTLRLRSNDISGDSMADNPHKPITRARPLSPFTSIYRWSPTMATSITHRITGVGLGLGIVLICWWLIATASGPDAYEPFMAAAANPLGKIVLFGFTWALAYHLLNGIRHLVWDVGYGFDPRSANTWSVIIIALSLLMAVGAFAYAFFAHGAAT